MAGAGPGALVSKLWASPTPADPTSLLRLDGAESSRVRGRGGKAGAGGVEGGGWERQTGERKGEKGTKSNGFEEQDSNQFLILARGGGAGKGVRKEKGKSRRKKRGMRSVDMKGFP